MTSDPRERRQAYIDLLAIPIDPELEARMTHRTTAPVSHSPHHRLARYLAHCTRYLMRVDLERDRDV